jgi:protein-S-isoprenylcysteine O-methyltransferase Ste14
MSLTDRYADFIYRVATTKNKLKIIALPIGLIFWLGLSVAFILASLWLDKLLPVHLLISSPTNLFLSVPILIIGATLGLGTVYSFARARGSPVPLNPPKKLVTAGLNSWIRNPMLLGWFILLLGLGILLNSIALIFIFTPLFILVNVLYVKNIEEKEMEKKFGEQYLEYKKSVPMFIPRFGKRK